MSYLWECQKSKQSSSCRVGSLIISATFGMFFSKSKFAGRVGQWDCKGWNTNTDLCVYVDGKETHPEQSLFCPLLPLVPLASASTCYTTKVLNRVLFNVWPCWGSSTARNRMDIKASKSSGHYIDMALTSLKTQTLNSIFRIKQEADKIRENLAELQ